MATTTSPKASDADLERARDTFKAAIPDLAGRLLRIKGALDQALAAQIATDKAELEAALRQIPKPARRSLGSTFFDTYVSDGDAAVLGHVAVGGITAPHPTGEKVTIHSLQPFLAATGAIVLLTDAESLDTSRRLLRDMLLRAAVVLPHSTGFTISDPKEMDSTIRFAAQLPRLRPRARMLSETFDQIADDIRRISQHVVGTAERFFDLTNEARSGEVFELIALVDFPHAYQREGRALETLMQIANRGPRSGRHVIFEYNTDSAELQDFPFKDLKDPVIIDCRKAAGLHTLSAPKPEQIGPLLQRAQASGTSAVQNDFATATEREPLMQESSADRIIAQVGERLSIGFGRVDTHGEVAHGVIAGQVGSGKSHLLHVIIAALTRRYAPQELRLFLLDAKQGVEFKAYEDLPHAEVVSLRTRPLLARRILADFRAEMEHRYEIFKAENVNNLSAYRAKTGAVMPRMLMVVDEYQLLFEGDGQAGRDDLEPILSKGRAAGMHMLLCAQRFDVDGMRPNSFNEIHLRISLKLAQDYVQTISAFSSEGKRMILGLATGGEVVINTQSGADGANQRGAVMRLGRRDDHGAALSGGEAATLESVLEEIRLGCGAGVKRPVVLDGTMTTSLADNPFVMAHLDAPPTPEALQAIAQSPTREGGFEDRQWRAASRPMMLWAGRNFDVHSHAGIALRRERGQNLLMLGQKSDQRAAMLAQMLIGLVATVAPNTLDILLLDRLDADLPGGGLVRTACEWLRGKGASVTFSSPQTATEDLASFAAAQPDRHGLLILCEPDRLDALTEDYDPYMPATSGFASLWRKLLQRGPERSRHMVVSASSVSVLGSFMNLSREGRAFTHRLVQQMSVEDSTTLFTSMIATRVEAQTDHPMGALYLDATRGEPSANFFAGYSLGDQRREATPQTLAALLSAKFGGARVDP